MLQFTQMRAQKDQFNAVAFQTWGKRLFRSIWFFPFLLAAPLIVFVLFQVSGTSVGVYHDYFYGQSRDPSLLYGEPRPIRSDEWLVGAQLTTAQSRSNFPRVNQNFGSGQDMSIAVDVPYKDWSAVFKPQNLVYFILPLGFAYALKWWLILYVLVISCYFFTLRIFPRSRLFAALASLSFAFSPFVFWWYLSPTILTLAYGFLLMILAMRIINREEIYLLGHRLSLRASLTSYGLVLAYILSCFALLVYPPFQIPIALVVFFFVLGYWIQARQGGKPKQQRFSLMFPALVFVGGMLIAGVVVGAYIYTRRGAVHSITHTVYPGAREVYSGGYPIDRMLATFLQPQLQSSTHGPQYYDNQSESSNFILLLPYIFLPGMALLLFEWKNLKKFDWTFAGLNLVSILFFLNLFAPLPLLFAKADLLDKVPHERLAIGLGFLGYIYLLFLLRKFAVLKLRGRTYTYAVSVYTIVCLCVCLLVGRYTKHHFPLFITSRFTIVGLVIVFSVIIALCLLRRPMKAIALLLLFSFLSIYRIDPLYRGLGLVADNRLTVAVQNISKPGSSWTSLDDIYLENFATMSNRESITGVQIYPDLGLWQQVNGPQSASIYNRYAHVISVSDKNSPSIRLIGADFFTIKFECSPFIEKHIQYAISEHTLDLSCVRLVKKVPYPARTFYIYKVAD